MERLPPIARVHLQRPPSSDHPDADLLSAFAEQVLPPPERQHVLEHLSRCAQCRAVAVLAGAAPQDALREREYELVAAAAGGAEASSVPEPGQAPGRSPASLSPPAHARRLWLGYPPARWIAAAACALICANVLVRPGWWHGKHPEPAANRGVSDQIADNRRPDSRSDFVQPDAPAASLPAEPKAERGANGERRVTRGAPRSATPKMNAAGPGAVPPSAKPGAAPAYVPAPMAPSRASSPAGRAANAAPGPGAGVAGDATSSATSRSASGGVLGGMIGGSAARVSSAQAGGSGGGVAPQATSQSVTLESAGPPQWSLSAEGIPQRSNDSGHNWQKFRVDPNVQFRALYADQSEVWVGGPAGILYHTSDLGAHWTRVRPTDRHAKLSGDIVRIDFRDALHGDVTTAKSQVWTTQDGGVTWTHR